MCAVKSYTFENVRRTHTIEVAFMKAGGNSQTGVFVDVPSGSYYEEAVTARERRSSPLSGAPLRNSKAAGKNP